MPNNASVASRDPSDHPMVVAICAFRVENVRKHLAHNMAQLSGDEYCVLLDRPVTAEAEEVAEEVRAAGGTMRILGATNGLSASRNAMLARWPHHHLMFVDDDVRLDAAAVDAVRKSLRDGAHVVGTRLARPALRLPWYVTSGQFHLVGWHRDQGNIKIWGACMGVDSAFAHAHGLDFDLALSRTGGNLQSGEDTSFISAMKAAGAREQLLPDHAVTHDIDPGRLTPRYLLRRAYWQGRCEAGRNQARAGLRKEWDRHRTAPESRLALPLALGYTAATAAGLSHELLRRARLRRFPPPRRSPEPG
ncbi:glycosyl hydrolase [Micromonospora sp. KC207]|uniref:glycosyl hydrolase n=1 Tax=Micromonospora sp. KC207 TaxID=2530377 RepID=UPI001FB7BD54|nr:glycosyl hydrolase [Micromonospora sp. KC207]